MALRRAAHRSATIGACGGFPGAISIRPRRMYFLKKVFQLRDKANPDLEKPFLEHLEDLRIMITRMVITLVVAMVACFSLQDQLMDVLRRPVLDVWNVYNQKHLPENFDVEDWEHAKHIHDAAADLESPLRDSFLGQFDDETRRLVRCVALLRASQQLPEDRRETFLTEAAAGDPELGTTLSALGKSGADPVVGQRGNLRMMSALKPTETFMLSMKLAFFAGIVVSFPFLLLFLLQFVLPGLHANERRALWPAMAIGFGLFLLGVGFAYFVVLPRALEFFFEWGLQMGVENEWRIGEYISFATQFTLLFGLSFELPVVVMVFVKIGLLTWEMMHRTRSYAVLAIVVAAAAITPTSDLLTLSLMAVPMYVLYELCILLAWLDHRKRRKSEEEERREHVDRLLAGEDELPDPDTIEPDEQPDRGGPDEKDPHDD